MSRHAALAPVLVLPLILLPLAMADAQNSPPPQRAALHISFEEGAVAVKGPLPGEKVALFSVAREATGTGSLLVRREEIVTAEADGTARLALDRAVPPRSVWAAVDLATGDLVLATPGEYPLRQMPLPLGAFRPAAAEGFFDRVFAEDSDQVEIFVARPMAGAWALTVWDGAPEDEDGPANRRLSLAFPRMEPVGGSPAPPEALKAGDVVVLMDPNAMRVSAARLPGGGK